MGTELEDLASRKQLLVTRAALQRLHATVEVSRLREKSRWVRSIAPVVLLLAARRPRLGRIAWWAGIAYMAVRLFSRGDRVSGSNAD